MADFVPEKLEMPALAVPYFEEQSEQKIPGRGTEKSPSQLQAEIRELMGKLGATNVIFTPGKFQDKPIRYGYQMTFMIGGMAGRMEVAALPMKNEAPGKKEKALAQALYLVRNWLEGEVFSQVYRPGNVPLLPYLIGPDNVTVQEAIVNSGKLPLLKSSSV